MNVFNGFRAQCYWSNAGGSNWTTARNFAQARFDMTDGCGYSGFLQMETAGASPNPTLQYLDYNIDLSTCISNVAVAPYITGTAISPCGLTAGSGSGGLPESAFLHWADTTVASFTDGLGATWGPKTYTCTGSATLACRVEVQTAYYGRRWVFNVTDASYQTALKTALAVSSRHHVFLDEHWIDFYTPNTDVTSGGHVLEYPLGGGTYTSYSSMNSHAGLGATGTCYGSTQLTAYDIDVCNWLRTLATANAPTRYYPNIATEPLDYWRPLGGGTRNGRHDAMGAKSFATETYGLPQFFAPASGVTYDQYIEFVRTYTAGGGFIFDYGSPQVIPEPSENYNAGNYATAHSRAYMWHLAHYYMMKEAVGSTGKVWFSPMYFNYGYTAGHELDFTVTSGCSDDPVFFEKCIWLPAYQVDVGQPTDQWRTAIVGTFTTTQAPSSVDAKFTVPASQPQMTACPGGHQYVVWFRMYTRAMVLIRATDDCLDYGDASGLLINLVTPRQILKEDGTRTAAVSQVTLRMGEALILGNP
jgi:hypothetical protein